MSNIADELKEQYGYTSHELALVKYAITSILSELSKLIIMGLFFYLTGYFAEFMFSTILLLFLRINIGGLHCRHYLTCFILTFTVSYASVTLLPQFFTVSPAAIIVFSIIFMIICFKTGPIASPFRPMPDGAMIRRCRNTGTVIFLLFILFVSIFQSSDAASSYMQTGFWTITLHTLQMIVAKILNKEEQNCEKD